MDHITTSKEIMHKIYIIADVYQNVTLFCLIMCWLSDCKTYLDGIMNIVRNYRIKSVYA